MTPQHKNKSVIGCQTNGHNKKQKKQTKQRESENKYAFFDYDVHFTTHKTVFLYLSVCIIAIEVIYLAQFHSCHDLTRMKTIIEVYHTAVYP